MLAEINTEDLRFLVDEIFATMAGVQLAASPMSAAFHQGPGHLVSTVQLVGDWQGAVCLDIDLDLARLACANLLGVEARELSMEDIRDAAGELANMAGGSVKTLCAPASRLSLPTVVMGNDFQVTCLQGTIVQELSFSHECGNLTVRILEKQTLSALQVTSA